MNDNRENSESCELVQDELAELSFGTLSGRRRSEVLDHVESCSHCSAELDRLSTVADALLLLAPEIEPPLGFETRLADKLRTPATRTRPGHLLRVSVLSAAAMIIVATGFVLGAWTTHDHDNDPGQSTAVDLTSANLMSHGQVLGDVMISRGSPAWMFMTIDADSWSGSVTCEVTLSDGKVETIGVFNLSSGYGAWGAPLTSPTGMVRSARLVTPNGAVVASARLST